MYSQGHELKQGRRHPPPQTRDKHATEKRETWIHLPSVREFMFISQLFFFSGFLSDAFLSSCTPSTSISFIDYVAHKYVYSNLRNIYTGMKRENRERKDEWKVVKSSRRIEWEENVEIFYKSQFEMLKMLAAVFILYSYILFSISPSDEHSWRTSRTEIDSRWVSFGAYERR